MLDSQQSPNTQQIPWVSQLEILIHRENGSKLGMVPSIINLIYTLYIVGTYWVHPLLKVPFKRFNQLRFTTRFAKRWPSPAEGLIGIPEPIGSMGLGIFTYMKTIKKSTNCMVHIPYMDDPMGNEHIRSSGWWMFWGGQVQLIVSYQETLIKHSGGHFPLYEKWLCNIS